MPVWSPGISVLGSYLHLIRHSTWSQVKDSVLCACSCVPPVNLVTSLQFSNDANTMPDVTVDREMEKNSNRARTVLLFSTAGTKNTFVDGIEKGFYQETLTKTNHAALRFSQEILTAC